MKMCLYLFSGGRDRYYRPRYSGSQLENTEADNGDSSHYRNPRVDIGSSIRSYVKGTVRMSLQNSCLLCNS